LQLLPPSYEAFQSRYWCSAPFQAQTVALYMGILKLTAKPGGPGRKAARKLLDLCLGLAPAKKIAGVKSGRVVYPLDGAPQKFAAPLIG